MDNCGGLIKAAAGLDENSAMSGNNIFNKMTTLAAKNGNGRKKSKKNKKDEYSSDECSSSSDCSSTESDSYSSESEDDVRPYFRGKNAQKKSAQKKSARAIELDEIHSKVAAAGDTLLHTEQIQCPSCGQLRSELNAFDNHVCRKLGDTTEDVVTTRFKARAVELNAAQSASALDALAMRSTQTKAESQVPSWLAARVVNNGGKSQVTIEEFSQMIEDHTFESLAKKRRDGDDNDDEDEDSSSSSSEEEKKKKKKKEKKVMEEKVKDKKKKKAIHEDDDEARMHRARARAFIEKYKQNAAAAVVAEPVAAPAVQVDNQSRVDMRHNDSKSGFTSGLKSAILTNSPFSWEGKLPNGVSLVIAGLPSGENYFVMGGAGFSPQPIVLVNIRRSGGYWNVAFANSEIEILRKQIGSSAIANDVMSSLKKALPISTS